ncbi:DUF1205 domain-containing protein [Catellatospora sp. KI3]|uniref:nucleotide disphospho-sugar-binding domain-containing protein n=1 Tax=Catellatospora sp. KI3 TaxID=3041620 RepID=UPI0024825E80|nr:nucleotide disphospho-sugar-binding domain-containing protein [Catellatospora sp. KI3]MDI1461445.1 DUF1205 domain-containing protein [Catellatospora sp. KI3]
MRVLFTTAPLHGHLYPLVPLAWAFRTLGHEVLVACSDHFTPVALHTGLPVIASGPGAGLESLATPDTQQADARYAHGLAFGLTSQRNLAGTLSIVDSWRPDLVVAERAELAGPVAAAARGIPHVEVRWGTPEMPEYRAATEATMRPELDRLGLAALPEPATILNPWPPSMRQAHAGGHTSLRHVPYDGVSRLPEWLACPPDKPRLCLTLGTLIPALEQQDTRAVVLDILESLAGLGVDVVFAVDDAFAARLGPLPEAVSFAGRVPLSLLLRTCRVFVNHGGQGSALTAVAAGCPQVLLPKFDDMFDNAGAVVRAGAGLAVPLHSMTPLSLVEACRQVLEEESFHRAAAVLADEVAAQPSPVDVAARLLGLPPAARPDGGGVH